MIYRLLAFNARFSHSCLALFYVRTALEANLPGCRPEIIQHTINDPYYPTLRYIGSGNPAALFFSVYIWNSLYIQRLVNDLVKLHADTPIILGGPQAVTLAQTLPPDVSSLCTVVIGEIEGIANSFYADLAANRLQRAYRCDSSAAFNSPYRQEDFTVHLQNRNIYYESSRGCPYGCTYCLSASAKGVRHLPTAQVQEELRYILHHKPKIVRFVDRTFNDQPERALDIWSFLEKQPGETLFHFEMAPDRFTEEMFLFLEQVRPGRFQFEIGVQTTNPQTLKAINRKCNVALLEPNIRKLMALDTIHIHLDLILGLPYEDRDSFLRSFADVFRLRPHYIQMGLLKVLPDTPIQKLTTEYDLVVCESPPYELLANRWLNKETLEELFWFGECVEAFHNNRFFRSLWDYLRKKGEDITAFFEKLLILCRKKNFFTISPTQELLSSLLLESARQRTDRELFREFLIFDWLRCGHHFLPDHLEQEPIFRHKKQLWTQLPQNWEGIYDYRSRDEFFKRSVFYHFSENFLKEFGLTEEKNAAYVCFREERENTVFRLNSVLSIPGAFTGSDSGGKCRPGFAG
jgi:radical SAM superfamily enzyme YgiQ (UPF0313 family)